MSGSAPSASAGGEPGQAFRFCPSCGAGGIDFLDGKRWLCKRCGFEYFHNVATAAGVILHCPEGIALLERARDPGKGKLGLPGGFVDPGERAEQAALRECREEIGWAPPKLDYIGSFPNAYRYGGLVYDTCDLYFYYRFPEGADLPVFTLLDSEALSIAFRPLEGIREGDLAFPSLARAIRITARLGRPGP